MDYTSREAATPPFIGGTVKRIAAPVLILALCILAPIASQSQPQVSARQDLAIFAIGYYGWNIPYDTLESIDTGIQELFAGMGRFTVIGMTQRLSSGGLQQFIEVLRLAKQQSFVMPEKYQFGEAFLTRAEFDRLVGAFIVAAPVVTSFNSFWDSSASRYETRISTTVTFIDVAAGGSVIATERIDTSATSKDNQRNSIQSAVNAIPGELEYRIRGIPAFQIDTRILSVTGSSVRLQLGSTMGLERGDEYAIIEQRTIEGFNDDREAGLIVITDVGPEVSTGSVLYTSIPLGKNTSLREIPRRGLEFDAYLHGASMADGTWTIIPGVRATMIRGFAGFRPYLAAQVPLGLSNYFGSLVIIPINAIVGAEYALYLGRISLAPYAGIGLSYFHITSGSGGGSTDFLSHFGGQAGLRLGYLLGRDLRLFADLGFEGWVIATAFPGNQSYGGFSLGGGITFKY
jgi:hypothetical protein